MQNTCEFLTFAGVETTIMVRYCRRVRRGTVRRRLQTKRRFVRAARRKVDHDMNAKGDANRSVRMTKRRLCDALIALLAQKPVREITVRELTALAKVSRGTFYFHYTDIYDLLAQIEKEQFEGLDSLMGVLLPGLDSDVPPEALRTLFHYLNDNEALCTALMSPNGDPVFVHRIREMLERRCIGHFTEPGCETPRQLYLTSFAVNGCVGSIEAWLLNGRKESPDRMAAMLWDAVRAIRMAASTRGQETK